MAKEIKISSAMKKGTRAAAEKVLKKNYSKPEHQKSIEACLAKNFPKDGDTGASKEQPIKGKEQK